VLLLTDDVLFFDILEKKDSGGLEQHRTFGGFFTMPLSGAKTQRLIHDPNKDEDIVFATVSLSQLEVRR